MLRHLGWGLLQESVLLLCCHNCGGSRLPVTRPKSLTTRSAQVSLPEVAHIESELRSTSVEANLTQARNSGEVDTIRTPKRPDGR
jgi:hypothetical protein